MKRDTWVALIGHLLASILGLAGGFVVLSYIRPQFDYFHLFNHPEVVADDVGDLNELSPKFIGHADQSRQNELRNEPNNQSQDTSAIERRDRLSAGHASRLSLPRLLERTETSVVHIEVDLAENRTGYGAGVVVKENRIVATGFHVINRADSATVHFKDGRTVEADGVLNYDEGLDVALLAIDAPCRALPLASTIPLKGESVIACGSPSGLAFSVSEGIVSGLRRGVNIEPRLNERGIADSPDAMWIQTTAPITRGNSGGPLINMQGNVVGLNIFQVSGEKNINFAISSRHLGHLVQQSSSSVIRFSEMPWNTLDVTTERQITKAQVDDIDEAEEPYADEARLVKHSFLLDISSGIAESQLATAWPEKPEPPQIQIVDLGRLGAWCEVQPENGVLSESQPVILQFRDYAYARIRLLLKAASHDVLVQSIPEMDMGLREPVPLTKARLANARRPLDRRVRRTEEALVATQRQRQQAFNYINSPGLKSLQKRGEARAVVQKMDKIIPSLQKRLVAEKTRLNEIDELTTILTKLDKPVEIRYEVRDE